MNAKKLITKIRELVARYEAETDPVERMLLGVKIMNLNYKVGL